MVDFSADSASPANWREELHAVILTGLSQSLQPLVQRHTKEGTAVTTPKALLPVGNQPLLFYPLVWLQDAGVKNVTIVVTAADRELISQALSDPDPELPSISNLSISLAISEDSHNQNGETASILKRVTREITSDVIVLPFDFIPASSLQLSIFLDPWRSSLNRSLMAVLLSEAGEASKDGPPPKLYGVEPAKNLLVYAGAYKKKEDTALPMSLLLSHQNINLLSNLADTHVYLLRQETLALLRQKDSIRSIEEDLVKAMCALPYRTSHQKEWLSMLNLQPSAEEILIQGHSLSQYSDSQRVLDVSQQIGNADPHAPDERDYRMSDSQTLTPNIFKSSTEANTASRPGERLSSILCCRSHIHPSSAEDRTGRVHSITAYIDFNRQLVSRKAASVAKEGKATGPQTNVDSIIAPSVRIGERTTIKKSVIGPHCVIGKMAKITGCVIMDHVEIKDGVKLENTIVSSSCTLNEQSSLKDCVLGPGFVIEKSTSHKGETFSRTD